jgi:UDP:flavonoid glycosyltransferase YjiC (YdhE family)
LPYRSNEDVPKEILDMPKDKPVIYFAMGSSGKPKLIAEIIEGFNNKPYRVIAPVKSHIKNINVQIPENVIVTGFVPAHKVNPLADVSVIHGGQNTVMNACLSGTPIVGVGMHAEQQANLDACVRKSFAIRIIKREASANNILEAVDKILNDKKAKLEVNKFKDELAQWDGPANAAKFLYEKFGRI